MTSAYTISTPPFSISDPAVLAYKKQNEDAVFSESFSGTADPSKDPNNDEYCYYPFIETPGKYNPPIAHYTEFDLKGLCDPSAVPMIIGKEGVVFKAITHQSRVKYLWYNEQKHVIELWGAFSCFEECKARLLARVMKINDVIAKKKERALKKEAETEAVATEDAKECSDAETDTQLDLIVSAAVAETVEGALIASSDDMDVDESDS